MGLSSVASAQVVNAAAHQTAARLDDLIEKTNITNAYCAAILEELRKSNAAMSAVAQG